MFVALSIIAIGTIYLLKNFEVIDVDVWNILWPTLIIIIGLSIVFRQRRRKHWWDFFDNQTKEDWEHWGQEFGKKMESMGKKIELRYQEHPEEWEHELEEKIGKKIKSFFEGDGSSEKKGK